MLKFHCNLRFSPNAQKKKPLAAFSSVLCFPLCVQLYLWNVLIKGNLMFFWHDRGFESSFENKATDFKGLFLL